MKRPGMFVWNFFIRRLRSRPNDCNISTQHIATLLAQYFQALPKQSQYLNTLHRNIFVGCNRLHAFGYPVVTCCNMLQVKNQTTMHALVQHSCMNLATTSYNIHNCVKYLTTFKFEPTKPNTSQHSGQTHKTCCAPTMLWFVAWKCCNRLARA